MSNKITTDMAVVTIAYQNTSLSVRSFACIWLKAAPQLLQTMYIACSTLCICWEKPCILSYSFRNPSKAHLFTFEDNKRWQNRAICWDALNAGNPFLTTRMALVFRMTCRIDNNTRGVKFSDRKTSFIHVVDLWRVDLLRCQYISHCLKLSL